MRWRQARPRFGVAPFAFSPSVSVSAEEGHSQDLQQQEQHPKPGFSWVSMTRFASVATSAELCKPPLFEKPRGFLCRSQTEPVSWVHPKRSSGGSLSSLGPFPVQPLPSSALSPLHRRTCGTRRVETPWEPGLGR